MGGLVQAEGRLHGSMEEALPALPSSKLNNETQTDPIYPKPYGLYGLELSLSLTLRVEGSRYGHLETKWQGYSAP